MRDILFRGKRKDNGEWVFGAYFDMRHNDARTHQHHFIISNGTDISLGTPIEQIQTEIIPETLGQYTGLQDKNGNKIFEGDVIYSKGHNYLVVFWHGMFYASVEECNNDIYGGYPLHALTATADDDCLCEIVGNRFDYPNLIINDNRNGRKRKC